MPKKEKVPEISIYFEDWTPNRKKSVRKLAK
jgi:hypothetical protein